MKVYKSKEGYYYKIYKNCKKMRISQKEYLNKKQMIGGGGILANNILENYYLCTQIRYDKPIVDELLPMGSFDELEKKYGSNHEDLKEIKKVKKEIKNAIIVGSSQYGLYFRLVKKNIIDNHTFFQKNSNNFNQTRTFVFNFDTFLDYVLNKTNDIPLFWYSNFNAYGYTKYGAVMLGNDKKGFLEEIGKDLEDKLYDHELVCRIPIPINNSSAGFLGKINFGILGLHESNESNYNKKFDIGNKVKIDVNKLGPLYQSYKNKTYTISEITNRQYILDGFGGISKNNVILDNSSNNIYYNNENNNEENRC
jgi:hypothetical protein